MELGGVATSLLDEGVQTCSFGKLSISTQTCKPTEGPEGYRRTPATS
jgi:hypothetical protein